MKTKCWSCGKPADKENDYCYGCHHVVCISCVDAYGHMGNHEHGHKQKKVIKKKKELQ